MKTLNLIFTVVMIFISGMSYTQQIEHQQDIHKYITYQAWELVKHEHPEVIFSEMSLRIGTWNDGAINGTGPWQKGKVVTGAYREDEEDVVYKHSFPFTSATHFWDADNGDYATFTPPPYTYNYTNSYQKILAYWYGNVNNKGWLELGSFFYGLTPFYVRVKYDNLANAYKDHSKFLVTHWYDLTSQTWMAEDPPQPFIPYILENATNYSQAEAIALLNRICWEIVGRMCHHIEDSGVPAHAHNDAHVISDYFESIYIPQHFQEYTWEDAAAQGGLIDINLKSYPLRFAIYTTNQIADRFRSDDVCGDVNFPYPSQYSNDHYENILEPVYQSVENTGICEGPESIMQTVADRSFVYTIRSVAGFLWYVYKQFNIQRGYPPEITGFERNLSDNNFYLGETFKITCLAEGSDLRFDWFYKVCDTISFCNAPVNGLTFSGINNFCNIRNDNFRNYWTCQFYDSLCRTRESVKENLAPESLEMFVGVKVSNQYGQVTKYFGDSHSERIYPKGFIRPPDPPINGCPVAYTLTEAGYEPENNILHKSTFPENSGIDLTDKIVLKHEPLRNNQDNSLSIAINETAGDIDEFDAVRLISIDHPGNFLIAVSESNDIVFIDDQKILSPYHAEKNGEDVTDILKYDSIYSDIVNGSEKDIIELKYRPGNDVSTKQKFINELSKKYSIASETVFDSTAVILDPESDHVIHHTQKRPPGFITVFDSSGNKLTGDFDFTRRERRAMTTLPLQIAGFWTNVQMVFKEGFGISYCALGELLYMKDKVLENEHEIINVWHSQIGEVTKLLLKEDKERTVIDSTSFIILKFNDIEKNLPRGWKRDYVLEIKGRTFIQSDYKVFLNSDRLSKDNFSKDVTDFRLDQNYPNPFNPSTNISYTIPEDSFVSLKIYDLLGRELRHLVNEYKSAGKYEIIFSAADGKNDLMSGVYFYKISATGERGKFEEIRKMVVIR